MTVKRGAAHYACKVDENQAGIVDSLRAIGVEVIVASGAGCGIPDLICFWRGSVFLVEVKNDKRPPSARKLTAAQVWFHDAARKAGVKIHVVNNEDEALAVFGARRAA